MNFTMIGFMFTKALVIFLCLLPEIVPVESHASLKGAYNRHEENEENILLTKLHRKAQQKQQQSNNNNAFLPLKPPFRIIQIGQPRTGSTFQFQLLYAIANLKSPPKTKIRLNFLNDGFSIGQLQEELSNESFVLKAHILPTSTTEYLSDVLEEGNVFLFTSIDPESTEWLKSRAPLATSSLALYKQSTDNLYRCSLCEVKSYQNIFNLTNAEVSYVRDYMAIFEIYRRCCGTQMSKYEMARLNGCDVSEHFVSPAYPHCERYNKTQVEFDLRHHPAIKHKDLPGTAQGTDVCERIDRKIANGTWFLGEEFKGCEHHGFKEKVNEGLN